MRKDEVSGALYSKVHKWLKTNFGKADSCEARKCTRRSQAFRWALKRDCEYDTQRENFLKLCNSCHALYDLTEESIKKMKASSPKVRPWQRRHTVKVPNRICRRCETKFHTYYPTQNFCNKSCAQRNRFASHIPTQKV